MRRGAITIFKVKVTMVRETCRSSNKSSCSAANKSLEKVLLSRENFQRLNSEPNAVFSPRLILGVGWCCSVTELHLLKYLKQSDELLSPVADVLEGLVPETTNVNSAREILENLWIYDIQWLEIDDNGNILSAVEGALEVSVWVWALCKFQPADLRRLEDARKWPHQCSVHSHQLLVGHHVRLNLYCSIANLSFGRIISPYSRQFWSCLHSCVSPKKNTNCV